MRNGRFLEQLGQVFRGLDRGGTDEYGLAALVAILDVLDDRVVLVLRLEEDHVGLVVAHHRPMCRDDHDFKPVDRLELERLGVGGTGHAGQLLVQAKVVLEGDRAKSLVFALDRHAFLRLDGLVQAIGPASTGEGAPGELIDDDDLAIAHDVLDIALIQRMRTHRCVQVVHDGEVLGVVKALAVTEDAIGAQQCFGVLHAGFGQVHLLLFLVNPVVALAVLGLLAHQLRHEAIDLDIELR